MMTGPHHSSDRFNYPEWALDEFGRPHAETAANQRESDQSHTQTGLFGGPGAGLFGGHSGADPLPRMTPPDVDSDAGGEPGVLVRPYARTGGRTRPDYDLAIEALVRTNEHGGEAAILPEHRSICGLCQDARSVAEVAALLRLPLGVVRVLIGDMAGLGLVTIHQGGLVMGDRPSLAFLERVLSGLRRL